MSTTKSSYLRAALASCIAVILILLTLSIPTVRADTNGSELKTTAQPDKLVVDLGVEWAGAEFELKLDAGVFPVPVTANDLGIVSMDLGGSSTYTLTLINPPDMVTQGQHGDTEETITPPEPAQSPEPAQPSEAPDQANDTDTKEVSALPLTLFLAGLVLAGVVLAAVYFLKKRRDYYDDDYYDDDYEEDDS